VSRLKKLATGDLVAGVCAILLLILSFTKGWASYEFTAFGTTQSEGASLLDGDAFGILAKLAVLAALIAAIVFVVRAASGGPANAATLYMGLGALAFLLLLLVIVMGPEDLTGALEDELPGVDLGELEEVAGFSIESGRGILLYIGALLAAGIAAGGFMLKGSPAVGTSDVPAAPSV
jgi:hypothetical protein